MTSPAGSASVGSASVGNTSGNTPADNTPDRRVSLDEIRHKAEAVKSQAIREVRDATDTVVQSKEGQTLAIVVGIVVLAASFAFFLGSRLAAARAARIL
ncbi:MAG: hypothetical protein FWE94_00105 [Coriobacteriia bacterium]|nr:hypothetical protein [Coriobacteriia bacterium]